MKMKKFTVRDRPHQAKEKSIHLDSNVIIFISFPSKYPPIKTSIVWVMDWMPTGYFVLYHGCLGRLQLKNLINFHFSKLLEFRGFPTDSIYTVHICMASSEQITHSQSQCTGTHISAQNEQVGIIIKTDTYLPGNQTQWGEKNQNPFIA